MSTLMKFAQPIPEEVRVTLQEMHMNHPTFRCRQRAQAILLSVRGFTITELWSILDVRRDAISEWIDRWENEGLLGLYDRPRAGRPTIYTAAEVDLLKTLVDEEPRQIKTAQTKLADMTQKVASTSTLKRLLKKNSNTSGSGCVSR
jgi:transposase